MQTHEITLKSVRSKSLDSCQPSLYLHECGQTPQSRKTLVLATDVLESVSYAKKKKEGGHKCTIDAWNP